MEIESTGQVDIVPPRQRMQTENRKKPNDSHLSQGCPSAFL